MNLNRLAFIVFLLLFAQVSLASSDRIAKESSFYLGGIQVNEPDQSKWVSGLKTSGMNTVSVTVYGWQGLWDSDDIKFFEEDDETKIEEIRAAKSMGLNVVLIMRVALQHAHPENRFLWHGMIMPGSDHELRSWFDKYTRFVRKWARVADREGVDVFVIGSEMNALTATKPVSSLPEYFSYYENETLLEEEDAAIRKLAGDIDKKHLNGGGKNNYMDLSLYLSARKDARTKWSSRVSYMGFPDRLRRINERRNLLGSLWIDLIDKVSHDFRGPVSYAANYDNYQEVDFWEKLDFIGINAYFPLRETLDVPRSSPGFEMDLEKKWEEILSGINSFRVQNNITEKRVIFTELGYTYRRHSTVYPWGSRGFILVGMDSDRDLLIWEEEPLDFNERALAVRALYNAYKSRGNDFLAGMLYWKFSTDKRHLEIEPFLVHLGPDSRDPVLYELRKFLN